MELPGKTSTIQHHIQNLIGDKQDSPKFNEKKHRITKILENLARNNLLSEERIENYKILKEFPQEKSVIFVVEEVESKNLKSIAVIPLNLGFQGDLSELEEIVQHDQSIHHPYILKIEKVFFEKHTKFGLDYCCIVMPSVEQTLETWLFPEEIEKSKRNFSELRIVLAEALSTINYLHIQAGVTNLDLQIDSLFISNDKHLRLNHTRTRRFCNSGLFEPETFSSPKTDIFNFGAILYRLFVANDRIEEKLIEVNKIKERIQAIFNGNEENAEIIENLCEIIKICLSNDPSKRPSAAELMENCFFANNEKDGISSFEKLLEKKAGDLESVYQQALLLLEGIGYQKDLKQARKIFEELSKLGHSPSQFFFGFLLKQGMGGKIDRDHGEELCKSSAPQALKHFEQRISSTQDENDKFLQFYQFGAAKIYQGDYGVQNQFGEISNFDEANDKAFNFLKLSAEKNNSMALFALSEMHRFGLGNAERNDELAFELCKRSAAFCNPEGQFQCGQMIEKGRGVTQNMAEAVKYFELSANQAFAQAQQKLGEIFEYGRGVPRSFNKAQEYYKAAEANGLPTIVSSTESDSGMSLNKDQCNPQ